jgi:hypothetical protein
MVMSHRLVCGCGLTVVVLSLSLARGGSQPKAPPSVNHLSMEVNALVMLHEFRFTYPQLEKLRALAKETTGDAGPRQAVKVSQQFQQALEDLRDALLDALDEERIEQAQDILDDLREAERPEIDDDVEITEEARKQAPLVVRTLSARQLASFLAAHEDELDDPRERVIELLGQVRGIKDKDWKEVREAIADEVGWKTAGLDTEKATRIGERVVQLLIRARTLQEEDFKKQKPEMEKEASDLIGQVSGLDVARHAAERVMAELLSNPRLPAALDARLRK